MVWDDANYVLNNLLREGDGIEWPARSPALNLFDFFMRRFNKCFSNNRISKYKPND